MLIGLPWYIWLPVLTAKAVWKLFYYLLVLLGIVLEAAWKLTAGLCKLLAASWRVLVARASREQAEQVPESLVPTKSKPGPRDYNLP